MKVLITDHGFQNVETEKRIITESGHELVIAQCRTEEDLLKVAPDADALLVQWAPVTERVIAAMDACKVIVRYGIGVDNVDLTAAKRHGIPVCNVPDYCINEVADHTMALALAVGRQIPETNKAVLAGTWSIVPPVPVKALSEMVFAMAGFGRVARLVAERAAAFGFTLVAFDPYVDVTTMEDHNVRKVSEDELFSKADVLSLHLPLGPKTRHFVSRDRLASMKDDAIIVNTSRGGLIDTHALADALTEGKLSGAALDVFETEPLEDDHPLRNADRLIITSHTAWNSTRSVPTLQRLAAEEVMRALEGEDLANPVSIK